MSPAPDLGQLIAIVRTDAKSTDPLKQLSTASLTVAEIDRTTDSVLSHFVDQCRLAGHSWTEISEALGVTRQAAHKRFAITPAMDRFTPRARAITPAAQVIAGTLGHNYVGTEHLLIARFDAEGLAAKVLYSLGMRRKALLADVIELVGRGSSRAASDPVFTARGAEVISAASSEALSLGHNYVGTEHLLLALFRDEQSVGCRLLTAHGITRAAATAEVNTTLKRRGR